MEKNLNKYVTLDEASKMNYITVEMIMEFCRKNFIPYFQNFKEVLVNPEDIRIFFDEYFFGPQIEKKKLKKKKETQSEFPPEEEPKAE